MNREEYLEKIDFHFRVHSVCAILGPRQVGKTTLAKMYLKKYKKEDVLFLDLENPFDLQRLENPFLTLSKASQSLIVIDEIQRKEDLFPVIRVLADDPAKKYKFLILGSASRDLIRQSSETLAGRIGYIELMPFSYYETKELQKLWFRGGFPRSYLAKNEEESYLWRQSYISTFLERDIQNLGFQIPSAQMRRFWLMLVHYHGQIFNASEIGKSMGISHTSARKYLEVLIGTFMLRQLSPWHENLGKRQVKSPKIYFRDSGILHALLGIQKESDLFSYPKLGSFWEGFALEEVIRSFKASSEECYFWAIQGSAELDLFIVKNGKRYGFECKYTEKLSVTSSMKVALKDLKLDHLYVIFPGNQTFPLTEHITAQGLETISSLCS